MTTRSSDTRCKRPSAAESASSPQAVSPLKPAGASGPALTFWHCLSLLLFLYGLVVLSAGSGTSFFLIWFALAFLALMPGLRPIRQNLCRLPFGLRKAAAFLALLGVLASLIIGGYLRTSFNGKEDRGLPVIIVLGAQVREDGPSQVLRYRLDAAADYLEENPETLCIVTGGKGDNEHASEASGMADYLTQVKGVDPARILLEDQAENTAENMAYSKALLPEDAKRVGIITNEFHMGRALALAEKAGIPHPTAIAAPSDPIFFPNNFLREILAFVKDAACGNL